MDQKLEYITKLFKKMSAKGLETYVISRIWHQLDNNQIKIVPQQYVRHGSGQYSLTDLYFPQFNIHVEVNEPGHYHSNDKILRDAIREQNIIESSGHQVFTVDCTKDMLEIHRQIDTIINVIRSAAILQMQHQIFKPWQPDIEYKAIYYKDQSVLNASDNIALETIEQICELFQVRVPKMGFQRKGAVPYPSMENTIIWWPTMENKNWINSISPDGNTIKEKANNEKVPGSHATGV
ncbi:MAG TPA: hypothetical protein VNW51_03725, partial [Mucilaginibacter sp.]|nr:hypothetical protein [Mucilaginibacter sp.]